MFAGIDTHKDTLAFAIIDDTGRPRVVQEVPNTASGFVRIAQSLLDLDVVRIGIEGSGSFGRAVAIHFAISCPELTVVEVPTRMTSRERGARPGQGQDRPGRRCRRREDHRPRGESPTSEPRCRAGRGSASAAGLPGPARARANIRHQPCPRRAAGSAAGISGKDPRAGDQVAGRRSARSARWRRLDPCHIVHPAAAQGPGDRRRDRGHHQADRGSGRRVRVDADGHVWRRSDRRGTLPRRGRRRPQLPEPQHVRFSERHRPTGGIIRPDGPASPEPGGNRQLNRALYVIAITQIRADTEGRAYYDHKRAAGKTSREAIRCLKRRLSDQVFRTMQRDLDPTAEVVVDAADANEARLTAQGQAA